MKQSLDGILDTFLEIKDFPQSDPPGAIAQRLHVIVSLLPDPKESKALWKVHAIPGYDGASTTYSWTGINPPSR